MKLIYVFLRQLAYSLYDCTGAVEAPTCDPCLNDIEHGRVRGVAYIAADYYATLVADPTDISLWTDGVAAGKIFIIPATQGNFDGGAPVEVTGYGDADTKVIGYKFTLTYKDPTLQGNTAFYNSIKNSGNYYVAFRTETLTRISDNPATVKPKAPIEDDLNSEVVWNVEVTYSQPDHSVPFDTPLDLFTCATATPAA